MVLGETPCENQPYHIANQNQNEIQESPNKFTTTSPSLYKAGFIR